VTLANRPDCVNPSDDLRRSGLVVPGIAPGEDPGIQRAADDDRHARGKAFWQEIIERRLFEQGIAPGEQKGVPVAPFQRLQQHFLLVDADPDRPHDVAPAQLFEGAIAAFTECAHDLGMRLRAMLFCADIVNVENIDPGQAEPLQTVLERPHDRVVGVVERGSERHRRLRGFACGLLDLGAQQPPDFCRQHPLLAGRRAQRVADATLGLAEAVIGRSVDVAHAGCPSSTRNRFGLLAGHRYPVTAHGRTAEAEHGYFERGSPESALLETHHPAISSQAGE
jgi:hypothetical protein